MARKDYSCHSMALICMNKGRATLGVLISNMGIQEMSSLENSKLVETLVSFGKYRGMPWSVALQDANYMTWLEGQPALAAQYKAILALREQAATSRTPVHNRIQALFLDADYRRAFATVVYPDRIGGWTFHSTAEFEVQGADVRINCDLYDGPVDWTKYVTGFTLRIEIKPQLGDDYPAVLRQMRRNKTYYLFIGDYVGEGASEADVLAIFASAGITVIFRQEVETKFRALLPPTPPTTAQIGARI